MLQDKVKYERINEKLSESSKWGLFLLYSCWLYTYVDYLYIFERLFSILHSSVNLAAISETGWGHICLSWHPIPCCQDCKWYHFSTKCLSRQGIRGMNFDWQSMNLELTWPFSVTMFEYMSAPRLERQLSPWVQIS